MATLPQYALKTDISEFSIWGKAGPLQNTAANSKQCVGWTQIAFDHLNSQYDEQVCSSYFSDQVSSGSVGLALTLQAQAGGPFTSTGQRNQVGGLGNRLPPSILQKVNGLVGDPRVFNNVPASTRFWQGSRSLQLELRNPQQFGMRLNIYYVRSRQTQLHQAGSNGGGNPGADLIGNYVTYGGTTSPWSSVNRWSWNPLECYAYGVARKGVGADALGALRHMGLNDSPDFKDRWETKSVCSVYMPPGGTMFKTFTHKRPRILNIQHIRQNEYDRSSAYIVIKCVPEVQILPQNTALTGGVAQTEIAVLTQPGDPAAATPVLSTTLPDYHWIGTACYRDTYRILPAVGNYDQIQTLATIPVGTHTISAQGPYKQNNDIGTRSTTSVAP